MSSRILTQLLLSLLLLVSQQLAMAHGYAHLHRAATEQLRDKDDGSQTAPGDQLCGQCASAYQLAFAIGGVPTYSFEAVPAAYIPPVYTFTPAACLRAVCVFQPRAPPRV